MNKLNELISKNNINQIAQFIEIKDRISNNTFREIIHLKINSIINKENKNKNENNKNRNIEKIKKEEILLIKSNQILNNSNQNFQNILLDLIRKYHKKIPQINSEFKIISKEEIFIYFYRNIKNFKLETIQIKNNHYEIIEKIINKIFLLKSQGYSIMNLEEIEFENLQSKLDFFNILSNYEKFKKKNNLIDYADIPILINSLLNKSQEILDEIRNKFKYIIIEDFNELNKIEIEIIFKILNDNKSNITIISFFNSKQLIEFKDRIKKFELIEIKNLKDSNNKENNNYNNLKLINSKTNNQKISYIIEDIKENHERYRNNKIQDINKNQNQLCLIYNSFEELNSLIPKLRETNINFKSKYETNFLNNELIIFLIKILKIIENPTNENTSVFYLLNQSPLRKEIIRRISRKSSISEKSIYNVIKKNYEIHSNSNNEDPNLLGDNSDENEIINSIYLKIEKLILKKKSRTSLMNLIKETIKIFDLYHYPLIDENKETIESLNKFILFIEEYSKINKKHNLEILLNDIEALSKLPSISNECFNLNLNLDLNIDSNYNINNLDSNLTLIKKDEIKNNNYYSLRNFSKIYILNINESYLTNYQNHNNDDCLFKIKFPKESIKNKEISNNELLNLELIKFFERYSDQIILLPLNFEFFKENLIKILNKLYSRTNNINNSNNNNSNNNNSNNSNNYNQNELENTPLNIIEINYSKEYEPFKLDIKEKIKIKLLKNINKYLLSNKFNLAKKEMELFESLFSKNKLNAFINNNHPEFEYYNSILNNKKSINIDIDMTKQVFSVSQLKTYQSCPKKYLFQYIFKIPSISKHYFDFGTSIHEVLENLADTINKDSKKEEIFIEGMKLLHKFWISNGYESAEQEKEYFEKGITSLNNFIETQMNLIKNEPNRKIIEKEKTFTIQIEGRKIYGIIDRIDIIKNNEYEILDYKTSNSCETKFQLNKSIQLYVYSMALKDLYGKYPKKMGLWYLIHNKIDMIEFKEENLNKVKTEILNLIKDIEKHKFKPNPSKFNCNFCDYKDICSNSFK